MKEPSFEAFNIQFFGGERGPSTVLQFFGRKVVLNLDEERLVEVSLASKATHQHYEGYSVVIVNKQTGTIASHYFAFDEYLQGKINERTLNVNYQIIEHCGYGWYINVPSRDSVDSMSNIMMNYIWVYI